jgi:UDP-2-acetamido-3-amino-2,3-dideoxy-glucuronate N-acetyltransferase
VIDPTARIHASADLEDDVGVGPGTSVRYGARLRAGASVGRDGFIGRDVLIDRGVVLGDRVQVHDRALLYQGVTVDDGVYIGPGAILTNDRRPRALNAAGEPARPGDWTVSPVHVAAGASIGAGAVIVAGCDIGPSAMVGAGAVVTHDVPGHAIVAGNPARRIGWACACGGRLIDSTGHAAPAERERYAIDQGLACPVCDRRYGYGGDEETLQEHRPPTAVGGASA